MSNMDIYAEVAIATYEHKKKTPTSSIVERNMLLNRMQEKNRIKTHTGGGTQITAPLTLGENQTVQNIYGAQRFNTGASNTAAQLNMGWSEKVMVVTITARETAVNRGKEQVYDFMDQKMEAAHQTAENRMGMEIYGDGVAYESLYGLSSFVTASGGGSYGGVDPNIWPKWRNAVEVLPGGYTGAQLEDALVSAEIKATDGVQKPDLVVASVKHWKLLEKEARSKIRHTDPKYMKANSAAVNISTVSIGNMEVFWDSNSLFGMDLDVSYGLCTEHLTLEEHSEGKWQFDKGIKPIDSRQSVLVAPWMGALYAVKRRNHFLVYG